VLGDDNAKSMVTLGTVQNSNSIPLLSHIHSSSL